MLIHEELTRSVIGAFFEVYNGLGFGFLERIYGNALERELRARGHAVAREMQANVHYKGELVGSQRLDMIVDERLIVEIKSTHRLDHSAERQLLNYLKGTNLEVGLLLHFGPKAHFSRVVHSSRRIPRPSA